MDKNNLRECAREYRDQGLSVVPVFADSSLSVENWRDYQTRLPTDGEIADWFNGSRAANIAVLTGAASRNLVVIRFDGDGWEIARDNFLRRFPELSSTRLVQTSSGRLDLWFLTEDLTNGDGKPVGREVYSRPDLGEGTCTRVWARDGRVLAPPSAGSSGSAYKFLLPKDPVVVAELKPIVAWLNAWEHKHGALVADTTSDDVPALPEYARLPEELGVDASPWLDDYITFSRKWSPRSYEGFHEAIGLWLLSTVAARRVVTNFGGERFPALYVALVAKTSLYAKSTTADIGIDVLESSSLRWLLASDDATPQKFISDLAGDVPEGLLEMPPVVRERAEKRLALSAQRGWFYEEFGQKLSAMMRDGGFMGDFRGILRRFWDCPSEYTYGTISRGTDRVENPYVALLANCTPADLQDVANRSNAFWHDGFLARFALICPPRGARTKARFPVGERSIDDAITSPLLSWHERLGMPKVIISSATDGNGEEQLVVDRGPYSPQVCELGDAVFEAEYRYLDGLQDLVAQEACSPDLDGNLTRLPEMALRIALLLASLDGSDTIELKYWARAQAITERWRAGLHELYRQVNQPPPDEREVLREKVCERIEVKGGEATAAQIARDIWGKKTDDITDICRELCDEGVLRPIEKNGTVYYAFCVEV